jgi:hypothetical protein
MKKIMVFLVLFVLLAQAIFAEIRFRGEFKGSLALRGIFNMENTNGDPAGGIKGDDGLYDQPWFYSYFAPYAMRARFRVDAANENNTLGGFFRLSILPAYWMNASHLEYYELNEAPLGSIWWQPVSQFKATIGHFSGRGDMIGKIYLCDEVILPVAYWGRYHPDRFNSSWTNRLVHAWGWEEEAVGFSIELFPVTGLYIAATLPLLQEYRKFGLGEFRKDGILDLPSDPAYDERKVPAGDIFAQTGVRVAYTIRGFGQVVVSWDGGTGTLSRYSPSSQTRNFFGFDAQFINAHVNLTAVRNLRASIGFEIPMPISRYYRGIDVKMGSTWDPDELEKKNGAFTRQFPYGLDIRAAYTAGDFSIGSGLAGYFGGYLDAPGWQEVNAEGGRIDDPVEIGISLNPAYKLFKLDVGIVGEIKFVEYINSDILAHPFTFTGFHGDRGSWFSFNIIPYISKAYGGGSAWAGFQIRGQPYAGFKDDDGTSWKTLILWSIQTGITYSF